MLVSLQLAYFVRSWGELVMVFIENESSYHHSLYWSKVGRIALLSKEVLDSNTLTRRVGIKFILRFPSLCTDGVLYNLLPQFLMNSSGDTPHS